MFSNLVQAQIKIISFKNSTDNTVLKTYSPDSVQTDWSELLAELNMNIKKVTSMACCGGMGSSYSFR